MLVELRVRNLAVIEDASLQLSAGLNVLTGETGAGKSMIVDALSLLLGERASTDLIRTGSDRAVVEAVFESVGPEVEGACEEAGIDLDDDRLVVRREINAAGKNRAWANGSPTTVGTLARIGGLLVDLHGQHETQSLLTPRQQRAMLDMYADGGKQAAVVARQHERVTELQKTLAELQSKVESARQRADYLRHVSSEIHEAQLRVGEDEELEVEAQRLANVEAVTGKSEAVGEMLDGDDGASRMLADVRRTIVELTRIDPSVEGWLERVDGILDQVSELARDARDYGTDIDTDPLRLAHVEERRDLIYGLLQKYGSTIEQVLKLGEESAAELDLLDTADLDLTRIEEELAVAAKKLSAEAKKLSKLRAKRAAHLCDEVNRLIPKLGMPHGRLEVKLQPLEDVGRSGAESVRFDVALNPGLPSRALAQVASGGELSRLMLALKVVLVEQDAVGTLVFDEVDQGIGGEVANDVARALREVSQRRQALVITHLAQIAAVAQTHVSIAKDPEGQLATADLRTLPEKQRVTELARMLGDPRDEVVLKHAGELLRNAGAA